MVGLGEGSEVPYDGSVIGQGEQEGCHGERCPVRQLALFSRLASRRPSLRGHVG